MPEAADRVAALLEAEGLTDILIDTGEHRALGQMPGGGGWPVTLASALTAIAILKRSSSARRCARLWLRT